MFRKDVLGNLNLTKRLLFLLTGGLTYPNLVVFSKLHIEGAEILAELPRNNVLFVSNHQTYFADMIAIMHTMLSNAHRPGNFIGSPLYLLNPRLDIYYIAAEETMRSGFWPRLLACVGSISVKRTWREAGQDVARQVKLQDYSIIGQALQDGWVVTFPQGTTTPYAPGRRGTSFFIKQYRPIVVPIVLDGFREAFGKKGIRVRKRGMPLNLRFKSPMQIDYENSHDVILDQIMTAIEQKRPVE